MLDQLGEKVLTAISIGSYTVGKVVGFATASASLVDTWHFQLLQELAFAAAIGSFALAVFTWHKNFQEKKRNVRHTKKPKTKD